MNPATVTALCTGIAAVIAAVTALIAAIRGNAKAGTAISSSRLAVRAVTKHLVDDHGHQAPE